MKEQIVCEYNADDVRERIKKRIGDGWFVVSMCRISDYYILVVFEREIRKTSGTP